MKDEDTAARYLGMQAEGVPVTLGRNFLFELSSLMLLHVHRDYKDY